MKYSQKTTSSGPGRGTQSPRKLTVRVISKAREVQAFDRRLAGKHYLGATPPVGDFLRQVVEREGKIVGQLVWGAAALKLKDREQWIGWDRFQRAQRLKLVVQNRRYLLLYDKGQEPYLASQVLAMACRALPEQWQDRFGYTPLLAETFTDPEAYAGTCYKASGWQAVGMSQGHSRHRADFYVPNERPKRLWMKELERGQSRLLVSSDLFQAICQSVVTTQGQPLCDPV